jgi:Flp pilus assembly protein TadG
MTNSPQFAAQSASRPLLRYALRRVARSCRRLLHAAPEQGGSGLVETAVVLPIFIAIVFGISQYAIVMLTYCNATYACRLASRYASMHSSASLAPDTVAQIQGLVTSRLFVSSAITPTVSVAYYTPTLSAGTNVVGNVVQVTVTWSQTLKLAFMSSNTFTISTQNEKVITR